MARRDHLRDVRGGPRRIFSSQIAGEREQPEWRAGLCAPWRRGERTEATCAIGADPAVDRRARDACRRAVGSGVGHLGETPRDPPPVGRGQLLIGCLADERVTEERDVLRPPCGLFFSFSWHFFLPRLRTDGANKGPSLLSAGRERVSSCWKGASRRSSHSPSTTAVGDQEGRSRHGLPTRSTRGRHRSPSPAARSDRGARRVRLRALPHGRSTPAQCGQRRLPSSSSRSTRAGSFHTMSTTVPPGIPEDPFALCQEFVSEGVLVFLGPLTLSSREATTQSRTARQTVIRPIDVSLHAAEQGTCRSTRLWINRDYVAVRRVYSTSDRVISATI